MIGKRYFFRTNHDKVYTGKVIDIDEKSPPLVFISILDKFGNKVILVHSEIVEFKEEQ